MTLTYTCFFPLVWYWLIKYFEEGSNKYLYTLLLVLNGVFWAMVHPYYLPAQTFFLAGVFALHYLVIKPGWKVDFKATAMAACQVVAPVLLIMLYNKAVDIHPGRPENPGGFFDFVASVKTVFLPAFQYLYRYVEPIVGPPEINTWEGSSYIGIVANVALLIAVGTIIKKLLTGRRRELGKNLPMAIKLAFGPTVLLLLLAMALPFSLNDTLAKFSQQIPYLRQFRSLGRFAWPFYYAATVYAVWAFYGYRQYFIAKGKITIAGNAIIIAAALVFATEGYIYHYSIKSWIPVGENFFKEDIFKKNYGAFANFKWQDKYQAALSIPYFRIGAENYGLPGTDKSTVFSFAFSYHTGIPLLASSAARTPSSEAEMGFQFFAPPFDKKQMEPYLPNKKDFLVLYADEKIHATQQYEVLEHATPIVSSGMYSLLAYTFNLDWKKAANDSLIAFENKCNAMVYYKGFYFDKPDTAGFYYWPLDTFKSKKIYSGAGAFESGDAYRIIYHKMYLKLDTAKEYVFSFWHYNVEDARNGFLFAIEQGDSLGNNLNWLDCVNTREPYCIYENWNFYEYTFKPRFYNGTTTLLIPAEKMVGYKTYTDEMMIRPAGVNVYKPITINGRKALNYNNYRIVQPE